MECIERNLITSILTTYHVKLTQSTALGQKRLDLRLLSPALCNIRLLLVMCRNFLLFYYICYVFLGPCCQKRCWSFSYKETHHSRQRKISIWKRRYSKAFLFCSVKVKVVVFLKRRELWKSKPIHERERPEFVGFVLCLPKLQSTLSSKRRLYNAHSVFSRIIAAHRLIASLE